MNDAPLPIGDGGGSALEGSAPSAATGKLWRARLGCVLVLLAGALLALVAMAARPSLPQGFWLGLVGVTVAVVAAVLLTDSFHRAPADAKVAGKRLRAPAAPGRGRRLRP